MLGLLMAGVLIGDFSIKWQQVVLTFFTGLSIQYLAIRVLGLKEVGYLSAIITCFGISLLLRSDHYFSHPLVAMIALSSKFLWRWKGEHIFNPAALGIVVGLVFIPGTWLSPGQWGFTLPVALCLFCLGVVIAKNARRMMISLAFVGFYLLLVLLRDWWLGWELDVTGHKFLNGSFILFSFFMISDPKTSARHFYGQLLQAFIVAALSTYFHYGLYWNNAFVYALIFSTPFVIISNELWEGPRYKWFYLKGVDDANSVFNHP